MSFYLILNPSHSHIYLDRRNIAEGWVFPQSPPPHPSTTLHQPSHPPSYKPSHVAASEASTVVLVECREFRGSGKWIRIGDAPRLLRSDEERKVFEAFVGGIGGDEGGRGGEGEGRDGDEVAEEVEREKGAKMGVVVLSGFLGAGKTTLVRHILHDAGKRRIAVLVNDMAEVNIDAALIKSVSTVREGGEDEDSRGGGEGGGGEEEVHSSPSASDSAAVELSDAEEVRRRPVQVVELSNGCICCTLREDLLEEVASVAKSGKFDYLVIESTGISEPQQVAETFTFRNKAGESLSDLARLDAMVTVVDGTKVWDDLESKKTLVEEGLGVGSEDHRTVVDLVRDQIEFANLLILNKKDLLSPPQLKRAMGVLRALNASAPIYPTTHSTISPEILFQPLFSFAKARTFPTWLKELRGEHVPETEEYGISSCVFRARRPFNPTLLHTLIFRRPTLKPIIRSKGFVWLSTRPHFGGIWEHVGRQVYLKRGGPWFAAIPKDHWPPNPHQYMRASWDEKWGDRHNEVVLIGDADKVHEVKHKLEQCLVPIEEMGTEEDTAEEIMERWRREHADPFLPWKGQERVTMTPK